MVNKRGRKNQYDIKIKPYFLEILEMCKTMTEQQIAESLGVGYSTWMKYKAENVEFQEIIKKGRQNLVSELRGALIKKAKGYEYKETKVVTEQVRWSDSMYEQLLDAGFTERQIGQARLIKTEVAHKEYPPDTASLNLALKNYDKDNWANDPQMLDIRKQEVKLKEKQITLNAW